MLDVTQCQVKHLQPFCQDFRYGLLGQAPGATRTALSGPSNVCTVLRALPKHATLHSAKGTTFSHFAKTFAKTFLHKSYIASPVV